MSEFLEAQKIILANEGGYADVKGDRGGETYCGIARNSWPNWEGWATIDANKPLAWNEIVPDPNLASQVNVFYKLNFWNHIQGDLITEQPIASYLYDFYVNAGGNAIKCLQTVLGVTVDGGFGKDTLAALNEYSGDILLDLHKARLAYYNRIAVNGSAKFLTDWCKRANDLYAKVG